MLGQHILVQTFPLQGSINPSLQFAKNIAKMGVRVTVVVSISVVRYMETNSPSLKDLRIVSFSNGYDDGFRNSSGINLMSQLKSLGSATVLKIITSSAQEGFPITGIVYLMGQTWAAEIARTCNIPSAVLWVQPATVFNIYFHYFNDHGDTFKKIISDPLGQIDQKFYGLPHLTSKDLPSFLFPTDIIFPSHLLIYKSQLETLDVDIKPKVLVNTFDELESVALQAIDKYNLIAIGPLVPSAYLNEKDSCDTSFGGDLIQNSNKNYIEWLDSKSDKSVVYISFGSLFSLLERQAEEIACGLVKSGRPFLWVIRVSANNERPENKLSCKEELDKLGMIVPWCSQVEVLSHPSLGCFLTHCGWNSSLESLVFGVPVVGLPQFADQPTNAKLLQDEFRVGVRARVDDKGEVEGDEIKRCVDLVMGFDEGGEEIRENAKKWKCLAKEATKEGGSSFKNLKAFVDKFEL